jgi:glycosyltransferase involved in cell wall biosynthesis
MVWVMARSVRQYKILLDDRAPWLVEFARALARLAPVTAYTPQISALGLLKRQPNSEKQEGRLLWVRFPVQRGYFSRYGCLLPFQTERIGRWLREGASGHELAESALICCYPHYARVAESWPGPVVYYATDLFRCYSHWDPEHIRHLERRMCRRAELVCPNSARIAEVLMRDAGAGPERVVMVPNGVSSQSLLPEPLLAPAALPQDVAEVKRPVAGVIGNLAANLDWVLIRRAVEATPWLSWVFVGPYSMPAGGREQHLARSELLRRNGGQVFFTGSRPIAELKLYARSFDVAVLPYRKAEPTYSGSSTRFYEHLAATRPMVATDGFAELLSKEPLLRIVRSPRELVAALEDLRAQGFRDGWEEQRWRASREATWECRAGLIAKALTGERSALLTAPGA